MRLFCHSFDNSGYVEFVGLDEARHVLESCVYLKKKRSQKDHHKATTNFERKSCQG